MAQEVACAQDAPDATQKLGAARRIFVSYRRDDSQGTTGRLTEGLEHTFGKQTVFRDIEAIRPGMNFVTEIEDALKSCVVLLAVIGPNWLRRLQSFGSQPTDGPVDYLRWELKTALTRGIQVIPVFVDGAGMPAAQDLPDELRTFALLQGHELTDRRWEYDLGQLIELLRQQTRQPTTNGATKIELDKRLVIPTVLGVAALVAVAVLYSGVPAAPGAGIDTAVPSFIRDLAGEHVADGGTALLICGALVALLRTLLGKYQAAPAGRLGDWLKNGHVFGVVMACVVVVAIVLRADRRVFAAAVVVVAAAYLAVRRYIPRIFISPARSGIAGTGILVVLAGALWADIAIDRDRQDTFDVAFLLPPEGSSDRAAAKQVFNDIKHALRVTLKNATNLEIVPDQLTDKDFKLYEFQNTEALLAYKARKGYARVFIRIKYNLDVPSGVQRIAVKPYLRLVVGKTKTIRLPDDWGLLPMVGRAASPVVALRVSFELVSFLSSKKLIRLEQAELQQFWRNLFDEYADAMAMANAECVTLNDELKDMGQRRNDLNEAELRRVLFAPCADGTGSVTTAAASNKAIVTATAPYEPLLRQ